MERSTESNKLEQQLAEVINLQLTDKEEKLFYLVVGGGNLLASGFWSGLSAVPLNDGNYMGAVMGGSAFFIPCNRRIRLSKVGL